MKRIAVIIFILLLSFTASADSCGNLSSSITLTHDMTSAGTCFVIKADNITIDCSGYWINYSQSEKGYGIHDDGYDNVNIKNCRFNNSVFSSSHAILLTNSLNSNIANVTAEFQSSESYGIFLNSSDYTNITDVQVISQYADSYGVMMETSENNYIQGLNITTLGDSTYGVYLSSSSKNHFSESLINTSGDYSHGIYLYLNSFNNSLSEVNITTSGDNAYAMRFEFSDNNTIIKSNVKTAGNSSYGLYIFYSDNNQFSEAEIDTNSYGLVHIGSVNNIMENSSIYSADSILSNSQSNNTIINTTFSKSGSSVVNNSYLYVKWFFDVHVKNGLGQDVDNANVTLKDKNNNTVFSEFTDNQGNIPGKKLLEYIKNSTDEYYFSNYTLSAIKYDNNVFQTFNLTENMFFDIFLDLSVCKQLYLNYFLVNEVTSAGTCFEIMANDIRLNCNNFPVYYSTSSPGYGVLVNGFNNTIIENCNFIHNNSGITNAYGIFLNKSSYGKIINSTVAVNSSRGIYLINSSFINLSAIIESNSSYPSLYLDRSHSNNLTAILKGTSKKLGLNRSSNNLIKDSIFYDDNQTFSWNSDNIFLNNTFDSSKIYFSNSNLTVKWYADLFVNDTDRNNASGVNITLWDKDNIEIFSDTTLDGHLLKIITEYWQNSSEKIFYTNYTANYTKTGYFNSSKNFNITESSMIVNTIKESVNPTIIIDIPLNTTYSKFVQLRYRASDNVKIDRCWWINVSGESNELPNCQNTSMILSDGQYNLTIYTNDTNSNMNFSQVFFSIDASVKVTFLEPTPDKEENITFPYLTVNVSIGEYPDLVVLEWNGVNESMDGYELLWSKKKEHLTNGNYTFKVWANDSLGNMNVSETIWVYVNYSDNMTPELTVYSPTGSVYSLSLISLNYETSDDVAVDRCWYKLNNGTNITIPGCQNITFIASLGINTLAVAVNDSSGNIKEQTVIFLYSTGSQPPPGGSPGGTSFSSGKISQPEEKYYPCQLDISGIAPETAESGKNYTVKVVLQANNSCKNTLLRAGAKEIKIPIMVNETKKFDVYLTAPMDKNAITLMINATNDEVSVSKNYTIKLLYKSIKLTVDDSLLENGSILIKAEKYHSESYFEIIVNKENEEIIKKYTQENEYSLRLNVSWGIYDITIREKFDGKVVDEVRYQLRIPLELRPYAILIRDVAIVVVCMLFIYVFVINIRNVTDKTKYGFAKLKLRKILLESSFNASRKSSNKFLRNIHFGALTMGKISSASLSAFAFKAKRTRKKIRMARFRYALSGLDRKFQKGHISSEEYAFLKEMLRKNRGVQE